MCVHGSLKTCTLLLNINGNFWDPYSMNITGGSRGGKSLYELLLLEKITVFQRGGGSEVSRITSHALMNDEHAGVGGTLRNNILEKGCSVTSGSLGSKGLLDGVDIIIDSLGHTDDSHLPIVLFEKVLGKLCCLTVGIISSDGVDNVDLILDELLGCNFNGKNSLRCKTTGYTVLHVGELNSRVTNGGSTQVMKSMAMFPSFLSDHEGISEKNSLVSITVHANS
mmetsp:Transcript_5698/g.8008  ORF Transcript_5698/g.8008 Transcript_5698/m.8008 type:complete len:224 (-) Transcript_5698:158-829(-)